MQKITNNYYIKREFKKYEGAKEQFFHKEDKYCNH